MSKRLDVFGNLPYPQFVNFMNIVPLLYWLSRLLGDKIVLCMVCNLPYYVAWPWQKVQLLQISQTKRFLSHHLYNVSLGDLASIFGCLVGLKKSITAITFVALGTSLPDTFASRLAAVQETTADNSIGNVTGSNSVNVFLGLGLPWFIASVYWAAKNKPFLVPSDSLGFSVGVYTLCSLLCIALLMVRRYLVVFGKAELGGPTIPKFASAVVCVSLWFFYVSLSALQAYGRI